MVVVKLNYKGETKMKKILNKKGFTLIELIVVIAILAILALILVPSITGYIAKATDSKNQSNARSEYSRVVMSVSTDGTLLSPAGASVASNGTYVVGALTCTPTFANNVVSAFSCTTTTASTPAKYWSLNNGFSGGTTN